MTPSPSQLDDPTSTLAESPAQLDTEVELHQGETASTPVETALFHAVVDAVNSIVFARDQTIRLAVACLVSGGHLLVEDLPGLGKTTLAKALARAVGLSFCRLQCTADLLPADIVGATVFDLESREPKFRAGPVFTNILMADELNRASPRAQSALLEAMEEQQVTVDGKTTALPNPFMVIATQNPFDSAGTSPLPHGQRDRFLLRLSLGYPDAASMDSLLATPSRSDQVALLQPAISEDDLAQLMHRVARVHVAPAARAYVIAIVRQTHQHPSVKVCASPRAAISLLRAAKAMAIGSGRSYVIPEDVQSASAAALAHRVLLETGFDLLPGNEAESVIEEVLHAVPVPVDIEQDGAAQR